MNRSSKASACLRKMSTPYHYIAKVSAGAENESQVTGIHIQTTVDGPHCYYLPGACGADAFCFAFIINDGGAAKVNVMIIKKKISLKKYNTIGNADGPLQNHFSLLNNM